MGWYNLPQAFGYAIDRCYFFRAADDEEGNFI